MGTIYCNGRIHTMDRSNSVVEALLEENGYVVATGSSRDVRALARGGSLEVDLAGNVVVPGLTDSHTHFGMFSLGLDRVNLAGAGSLGEALRMIAAFAADVPEGEWVLGGGFNKNLWGGDFPTRADLDSVCPGKPAAIWSMDCHSMWVNSLALKMCGIGKGSTVPEGGRIDLLPGGEPSGIVGENAIQLVERCIPKPQDAQVERAILKGMKVANGLGLSGVHVMEGAESFGAFQRLLSRGLLTLRVCMFIQAVNIEDAIGMGLRSGFGGEYLWIGGLKLFTDGALGSQTADMIEPYEGSASRGISTISEEDLDTIAGRAIQSGISVAIHAIGDAANRKALNVLARYAGHSRTAGLRNRIEHAQLLCPQDVERFAATGTIASVQPIHATSDRYMADRLWGKRAEHAYVFKSLISSGARVTFGSDAPVETIDPLRGIYAAVTRKREEEPSSSPWHPEQAISVEEAVRGYTAEPAYAGYREGVLGSLEPGKAADFSVLSRDIFAEDPAAILETRVLMNVVGGRTVFES